MVLALAASACSAVTPATGSPHASRAAAPTLSVASVDPCALLEPASFASRTGLGIASIRHVNSPLGDLTGCLYRLSNGESVTLIVKPTPIGPHDGESFLDSFSPDPDTEVHGYGDVAWFGHCPFCPAGTTTALTVAASPLEFTIALALSSPVAQQHLLADGLGRQIVDRLGL